jgi:hypothetical protein
VAAIKGCSTTDQNDDAGNLVVQGTQALLDMHWEAVLLGAAHADGVPALISFFGFGVHGANAYMALELAQGGSLDAAINAAFMQAGVHAVTVVQVHARMVLPAHERRPICARMPLPLCLLANLVASKAAADAWLQGRGLHHADCKPANFVVGDGASVKVIDLGMVAELTADGRSARPTMTLPFL